METIKEGFVRRLREAIKQSGKTQREVADHCQINQTTLSGYLRTKDTALPGGYNLIALCRGLNVSADYLLLGDEKQGGQMTAQNQEIKQIFPSGHPEALGSS